MKVIRSYIVPKSALNCSSGMTSPWGASCNGTSARTRSSATWMKRLFTRRKREPVKELWLKLFTQCSQSETFIKRAGHMIPSHMVPLYSLVSEFLTSCFAWCRAFRTSCLVGLGLLLWRFSNSFIAMCALTTLCNGSHVASL